MPEQTNEERSMGDIARIGVDVDLVARADVYRFLSDTRPADEPELIEGWIAALDAVRREAERLYSAQSFVDALTFIRR